MKILLDIDDTALITKDRGKTWNEHPRLTELISSYTVYLYSGNPDIYEYYKKWKTAGYIPKGNDHIPVADVLIDNDGKLWKSSVNVKKIYKSIDSFFRHNSKELKNRGKYKKNNKPPHQISKSSKDSRK